MTRLRLFFSYQRMAFRALFRRQRPAILDLPAPDFDKTSPEGPWALASR